MFPVLLISKDVYKRQVVSATHDTVPKKGIFCPCSQTGDPSPELVAQIEGDAEPVSYTHLDVYKRQVGYAKVP